MKVAEPAIDYGITIPVTIPSIGNYSVENLTRELTEFAMQLVASKKGTKEKVYSSRLMLLRSMSHNHLTSEDLASDERLAYLVNK